MLRDIFVIGLQERSAQKKLLSETELTLNRAVEIATGQEMANKRVDEMHINEGTVGKVYSMGKVYSSPWSATVVARAIIVQKIVFTRMRCVTNAKSLVT